MSFESPNPKKERLKTITLTSNEEVIAKLKMKLAEYEDRVDVFKAPELQQGTLNKIEVLETLLNTGTVDYDALKNKQEKRYGPGFSEADFSNAFSVITEYNNNNTDALKGSSGF